MNMMLLGDVLYGDQDAMMVFMGDHEVSHQGINQALTDAIGYPPQDYPLSGEMDNDWLMTHYALHQNISTFLGLTGLPDLSDVDLQNEDDFYDWMAAHNFEHAKINSALGLL